MTSKALRKQLLDLPVADRLELVEELWESIPVEDRSRALTPEQIADLEQRVAEADLEPSGGSSWDVVRDRITKPGR